MKAILAKLLPILKNKYYLAGIIFVLWVGFFDRNDLITQYKYRRDLNNLKRDKEYYQEEIIKTKADLKELTTNQRQLEKFAREKYLMKKENEDIFILVPEDEDEQDQ